MKKLASSATAQNVSKSANKTGNTYLVVQGGAAWEAVLLEADLEEGLVVGQGVGLEDGQEGDRGATYEASAPSGHQGERGV